MTAEIIVGIVFGLLNLILFYQQNTLMAQQNNIMREQLEREKGNLSAGTQRPPIFARYWPTIAMAVVSVLAWSAVITWISLRNTESTYDPNASKAVVEGKSFASQEVELDGKAFENCTFDNVTFVFKAKRPYTIANSRMNGRINLKFGDKSQQASADTVALFIDELCHDQKIGCLNGMVKIVGSD